MQGYVQLSLNEKDLPLDFSRKEFEQLLKDIKTRGRTGDYPEFTVDFQKKNSKIRIVAFGTAIDRSRQWTKIAKVHPQMLEQKISHTILWVGNPFIPTNWSI